jgi:peptidyl-tRNA hydrolase, PTH2 family
MRCTNNKMEAAKICRDIKQVIVMRNDLNMRKGKMVAQGAHASIMFLVMRHVGKSSLKNSRVQDDWMEQGMTKICVRVDSEEQLLEIYRQASTAGLTVHLITDAGLTEFDGPTKTCLAIGPNNAEDIDKITGDLKLL